MGFSPRSRQGDAWPTALLSGSPDPPPPPKSEREEYPEAGEEAPPTSCPVTLTARPSTRSPPTRPDETAGCWSWTRSSLTTRCVSFPRHRDSQKTHVAGGSAEPCRQAGQMSACVRALLASAPLPAGGGCPPPGPPWGQTRALQGPAPGGRGAGFNA